MATAAAAATTRSATSAAPRRLSESSVAIEKADGLPEHV